MAKASKNKLKVTPVGDRVLVKPLSEEDQEKTTDSGIIIPATVSEKEETQRGTVVAVGPGRRTEDGTRMAIDEVAEGNTVLFQWGEKVEIDGDEYYIVPETSILAVID
jgi:chaperonin GroES